MAAEIGRRSDKPDLKEPSQSSGDAAFHQESAQYERLDGQKGYNQCKKEQQKGCSLAEAGSILVNKLGRKGIHLVGESHSCDPS